MTEVANDEMFNPHRYLPTSENCQFLNVWTPGIQDGAKRPVMVWLHGGGWTNGSSIEQVSYDGENLSRKGDVVVVSLNHRINVLGYLDLSAFGAEYQDTGNVGLADMVAALEWVQANIAEFGGDPDNVTIFGQSGGGRKVLSMLAVPAAEGLVDKAVVQSSSYTFPTQEWSQRVGELTVENLGLEADQIADIQTVPYADLLEASDLALEQAAEEGLGSASWSPAIDGDYFPAQPGDPEFAERTAGIPLLVGSVLTERATVINNDPMELLANNSRDWSEEEATAMLQERFGENGAAVGEAFLSAYPQKEYAQAFFVDERTRPNVIKLADIMSEREGAPVYTYLFAFFSPVLDGVGMAWHCSEIPYVFDNVELVPSATGGGDAAQAMAHNVSQAWINFAHYGDPNHAGLPEWPTYTAESGATMVLDNVSYVGMHHDAELLSLIAPQ
jgi:para-nitrobenzyl esterase